MMDRQVVRQCDMEVMKMAMLKHEETFRQQVNDRGALHLFFQLVVSVVSSRRRILNFVLQMKCMNCYYTDLPSPACFCNLIIRSTSCTACTGSRGS